MGKTNKQKARDVNVQVFGRATDETSKQLLQFKRLLPKHKTEFRNIIAYMDSIVEEGPEKFPRGISASHGKIFKKLLEVATQEPISAVTQIKCPKCKKFHSVVCPKCGDHELDMPNALMMKNQIVALTKLADKFAPNLAAVSVDVDVNRLAAIMTNAAIEVIQRYVPGEHRLVAMSRFNSLIGEATRA